MPARKHLIAKDQQPTTQAKPSLSCFHTRISIISGIIKHLPPSKEKNKKQKIHNCTGYTAQHSNNHPLKTHPTLPISTVAVRRHRLRPHLNPILSLVSYRPVTVAAVVVGVVVTDVVVVNALAHAMHDDGAVDYLGESTNTSKKDKQSQYTKIGRW
jgi:hypothetical protein